MPKDDLIYVGHMLDSTYTTQRLLAGKSRSEYDRDEALQLAVAHLLQVIGEAARRVSAEYKAQHPSVPWAAIIGMRHKVVHDYLAVDYDIVWETATQDLPGLATILVGLVPPETPSE